MVALFINLLFQRGHQLIEAIKERSAFTVSIADAAHLVEADYFGVESGKTVRSFVW